MARSGVSLYEWCNSMDKSLLDHVVDKEAARKISYASHSSIMWKCDKGHIFSNEPYKFTTKRGHMNVGFRCKVCNGLQQGVNDLSTLGNKVLLGEWDYERNDVRPEDVTTSSHREVWWKCKYGHSWKARVDARVRGTGCPICSAKYTKSQPELLMYLYIKKYFPDAVSQYKLDGRFELDVFVPSINTAVEYDGSVWHSDGRTLWKNNACRELGINLLVLSGVRVDNPNYICFNDYQLYLGSFPNSFTVALSELMTRLGVSIVDYSNYLSMLEDAKNLYYAGCNSKLTVPDDILKMWSPLNGYSSDLIANDLVDKYWVCSRGHTFKRRYGTMLRTTQCPYCTSKITFRYVLIYRYDIGALVLDVDTCELEDLSDTDIIRAIKAGLNIRGVFLNNGELVYDLDYFSRWKPTSFRVFLTSLSDIIPYSDTDLCKKVANYLTRVISKISQRSSRSYFEDLLKYQMYRV